MTLPRFPRIPTPLELADAALDSAAEVVLVVPRVVSSLAHTVEQTAQGLGQAISKPKDMAAVPAPPDAVIGVGFDAAGALVNGVMTGITGVVDAVKKTGDGVKAQIDPLIRR